MKILSSFTFNFIYIINGKYFLSDFSCYFQVVKVRPGLLAVCPHCGILSSILSKCQRCQKGLPENVKIISSDACHKASVQYALPTQNFTSIPEGQSLPTKVSYLILLDQQK